MYSIKNSGFTLLEMLVAIGIFAMLGLATNSVLQTVIKDDEVTRDFSSQLRYLQQGFGSIERDMGQMVARSFRSATGVHTELVIQAGNNLLDSESQALVFYRIGWLNPGGLLPRGSIQSLAYVVQDGKLQRWYFPYPDPEIGAEPIKTVLMDKVVAVKYAFYIDGKWQQAEQQSFNRLPAAIAIEVELEDRGTIMRKFLLPEGAATSQGQDGEQSQDGAGDNKPEDGTDANAEENSPGGNSSGNNRGEEE
ncbi:type II secretion system minor pseudopilin GspJ [Shewanella dokdonensis]|uniref:Type II secretion system protein J n=1 Tax=Shewanella dokdonensis TaxID=712036 RepID=A0ABX8DI37_9GAMM|nr:type II secretion system minor pseudopilin GspJ [Shewanella dokdonensis]MCL1076223.1 type II secretion system minor pseudopilin GspJ [Shewanella dokdonensis]QVK24401.1 type II secretion system minor pseudopilin GspJ [Shewanella dokdonensis]